MAIGFSDRFDFGPVIGWELYQVTIDEYHLMFWFEGESALLNVAERCSFRSSDGGISFTYEIYGPAKFLNVGSILRTKIARVRIVTKDQLDLVFDHGDVLSIYDDPESRSWWFLGGRELLPSKSWSSFKFEIADWEPEDLTDEERRDRLS
jgi:hypothetical protein